MSKQSSPKNLLVFRVSVFVLTFLLYAAVHAVRKTLGTVTNPVMDLGYSKTFISSMNAAFMLSYAIGMMFTGALGDRFKPTLVLLLACTASAVISTVFGVMVPSITGEGILYLYVFFWILNGLCQSCVWPAEVKLMSNWFSGGHSGAIYGIWSANGSVGNILGIQFAAMCFSIWEKDATGIRWSFVIPSLFLILVAAMNFFLPDTPKAAGFTDISNSSEEIAIPQGTETSQSVGPSKMPFWRAWLLPGVIRYGLCYGCIKSVNYAIFFWLTPFLENAGHSSNTAYLITVLNDVGWIFGGLACGFGSDRMGTRAPFVGLFILLSVAPTALIYPFVGSSAALAVLVTLNGFLCGGAGNVVSSAVCADIGAHDKVKGSEDVTSQVAGIIDGLGAFISAGMQLLIGFMSKDQWDWIFYILTGMLVLAFLLISDLVYRETREWLRKRRLSSENRAVPANEVKISSNDEITIAAIDSYR